MCRPMSNAPTTMRKRRRSLIRRPIDQQRVQLWYAELQARAHCSSSYAMERLLIPEGFARSGGSLSHRNRMSRYAQGKHVPRKDLVTRAEQLFPGSRALLEHPYWEIIDPQNDVQVLALDWLMRLGVEVRRILFEARFAATDLAPERRPITRVTLRQLENRGSFEALAAVAVLLREAQVAGDSGRSLDCANSFWRLLLLLLVSHPFTMHPASMCEVAGDALLDGVVYQGERVAIAKARFSVPMTLLRFHCLAMEDRGTLKCDWHSWVREMLLLFRGSKGFDYHCALAMPTVATEALKQDPERYFRFKQQHLICGAACLYLLSPRWMVRSFMDDMLVFLSDATGRWPALD